MRRFSALCAALFLLAPRPSLQAQEAGPLQVSGFYRFYAGVRVAPATDFLVARNRVRLDLRYEYDRGRIFLSHDVRQDFTRPEDDRPYRLRYDLREAYLDAYFSRFDVRLGLQQIVWGTADGVFVTDLLSPLDLSEFLTQDFSDLRLAVPALKVDAYLGRLSVTGVLGFTPLPTRLPEIDSPWNPVPAEFRGLPVALKPSPRPEMTLRNTEAALRLRYTGLPLTTLSAVYLYGWNRLPALAKTIAVEPPDLFSIAVTPQPYRRHVVGGSFETTALGSLVLRGEAAYESRTLQDLRIDEVEPPTAGDPMLPPGLATGFLEEAPRLQSVLGIEAYLGRLLLRGQGVGAYVFGPTGPLVVDRFEPAATLLGLTTFRRETLTAQAFVFVTPGEGYWLNPSLRYDVSDGLNASLGAQFFGGPDPDLGESVFSFALYDDNDFVYLNVQYDF